MRPTTFAAALMAISGAAAQMLPSSIFGLSFSPQCQQAVLSVLTNGSFATCFHTTDLAPILTSNDSIVPVLDKFMSDLCYDGANVCSNETLSAAAQAVTQGCSSDLQQDGIPDAYIPFIFNWYPTVREVLCLKTSDPYTNASYGGSLGEPPVPINGGAYNSTNGYFCVTSLLTQLSAYFGTSLTVPFLSGALTGTNQTARDLVSSINANIVCNNCIFGAADVVVAAYPEVANVSIGTIAGALNATSPTNATIGQFMDQTCAYVPLAVSTNGTLPANVTAEAVNSTFPVSLTDGPTA